MNFLLSSVVVFGGNNDGITVTSNLSIFPFIQCHRSGHRRRRHGFCIHSTNSFKTTTDNEHGTNGGKSHVYSVQCTVYSHPPSAYSPLLATAPAVHFLRFLWSEYLNSKRRHEIRVTQHILQFNDTQLCRWWHSRFDSFTHTQTQRICHCFSATTSKPGRKKNLHFLFPCGAKKNKKKRRKNKMSRFCAVVMGAVTSASPLYAIRRLFLSFSFLLIILRDARSRLRQYI